jgi:tetratricopeptide (TPR) repeat protein
MMRLKKSGPRVGLCLLAGISLGFTPVPAVPSLADAEALYNSKRYAEARAILEPLVAAEPANAAASYFLGMTYYRAGGPTALDSARLWLGKAVKLAPDDENYLAEYSGVCLLMADRDGSFSLALEGRDGMSRAIEEKPADIEAMEGLMRFYAKAPWPLGDRAKALALAGDIASRDPKKGSDEYKFLAATFTNEGRTQEAADAVKAAQSLAAAHPH